jgi:hypothetical protein
MSEPNETAQQPAATTRANPLQRYLDNPEVRIRDFLECALFKATEMQATQSVTGGEQRELQNAIDWIRVALWWLQLADTLLELQGPKGTVLSGTMPAAAVDDDNGTMRGIRA